VSSASLAWRETGHGPLPRPTRQAGAADHGAQHLAGWWGGTGGPAAGRLAIGPEQSLHFFHLQVYIVVESILFELTPGMCWFMCQHDKKE